MPRRQQCKFYWLNPKLTVSSTGKYGLGTFATQKLRKGELALVIGGCVMHVADEARLPAEFNDNAIQVTTGLVLGVSRRRDLGGINFFNHSCEPNLGIKGQIFLVAMRDIRAGEEATFDYAMTLHRARGGERYRMKCMCGGKSCRGLVTDDDWKRKDLQDKYEGYFQYYIQEEIDRTRGKQRRA